MVETSQKVFRVQVGKQMILIACSNHLSYRKWRRSTKRNIAKVWLAQVARTSRCILCANSPASKTRLRLPSNKLLCRQCTHIKITPQQTAKMICLWMVSTGAQPPSKVVIWFTSNNNRSCRQNRTKSRLILVWRREIKTIPPMDTIITTMGMRARSERTWVRNQWSNNRSP